jgi:hypothetical protein
VTSRMLIFTYLGSSASTEARSLHRTLRSTCYRNFHKNLSNTSLFNNNPLGGRCVPLDSR